MSNDLPLYVASYRARAAARVERIVTLCAVTRAIEFVNLHERRIEHVLEELRCLRDGLAAAKLAAHEAELRNARAADNFRATHVRARPWGLLEAEAPESQTSTKERAAA